MTEENLAQPPVEPVETTQTTPTDAQETEVAQPHEEGQEPPKELTAAEKEAKALKRRVDRLTRERYQREAEWEQERKQYQKPAEHQTEPEEHRPDPRVQARELVEAERLVARCNDVVTQGEKEFKGEFTKTMTKLVEETGPLFNDRGRPVPLMEAILDSDAPHKVLKYLSDNPDIASELADMTSPVRQAKRLGQIERDMTEAIKPKRSNAPTPTEPVKGASTSTEPDPSDTARWISWRNSQSKRR